MRAGRLGCLLGALLPALLVFSIAVGLGVNLSMPSKTNSTQLRGDGNNEMVWNFLKDKGFTDEAAAGVMGNWLWESGGGVECNPRICQDGNEYDEYPPELIDDGSIGYGIAQWTYPSRCHGLVEYAKSMNLKSGDLEAQLGWFWEEASTRYEGVLALMSSTDIEYVCSEFQLIYENAGVPAMGHRLEAAQSAYSTFHGKSGASAGKAPTGGCTSLSVAASSEQQEAVKAALSKVGCPYQGSAAGPDSFDCSGLVYWAFTQAGYDVPRVTADGYWRLCQRISRSDLQPGDLVFWDDGWVNAGETMGHVAIYMGDDKCVQALNTTYGVTKDFGIDDSMGSGNVYFGRLPKQGR